MESVNVGHAPGAGPTRNISAERVAVFGRSCRTVAAWPMRNVSVTVPADPRQHIRAGQRVGLGDRSGRFDLSRIAAVGYVFVSAAS